MQCVYRVGSATASSERAVQDGRAKNLLADGPCETETVVRRCTSAKLINDDQTVLRGGLSGALVRVSPREQVSP